jgi:hypothetical protein
MEPGGETDGAQQAQMVLRETVRRIADGANDPGAEIGLAAT